MKSANQPQNTGYIQQIKYIQETKKITQKKSNIGNKDSNSRFRILKGLNVYIIIYASLTNYTKALEHKQKARRDSGLGTVVVLKSPF